MTAINMFRNFLNDLSNHYSLDEAQNITTLIFERFAGVNKKTLITQPALELSDEIIIKLNQSLTPLRAGKPVQYITGEAWFYKMKLKVSPAVLIPRPETEELVEEALLVLDKKKPVSVIDIGTGSGCIAIAIKKNLPAAQVTAIDLAAPALLIANENAIMQNTDILFIRVDFLEKNTWTTLDRYDLIISNPPYITMGEKIQMNKNVTAYEPHLALFVPDDDPLLYYRGIAGFAYNHLNSTGSILVETNEMYATEVAEMFTAAGFRSIVKKDMSGKDRMVMATRCP